MFSIMSAGITSVCQYRFLIDHFKRSSDWKDQNNNLLFEIKSCPGNIVMPKVLSLSGCFVIKEIQSWWNCPSFQRVS